MCEQRTSGIRIKADIVDLNREVVGDDVAAYYGGLRKLYPFSPASDAK
jgi:hypothetical protein